MEGGPAHNMLHIIGPVQVTVNPVITKAPCVNPFQQLDPTILSPGHPGQGHLPQGGAVPVPIVQDLVLEIKVHPVDHPCADGIGH